MISIELKPLQHQGKEWIGIYFQHLPAINSLLKQKLNARWSQTHQCWYISCSKESFQQLKTILQKTATLETVELKKYLEQRKQVTSTKHSPVESREIAKPAYKAKQITSISPVNKHVLRSMEQQLILKAYSVSTIRTYLNEMSQLLIALKDLPADDLKPEHLKRYLVYCSQQLKLKENTLHSRINAMKFYYEQVLYREKFFWEIPRPKKQTNCQKCLVRMK